MSPNSAFVVIGMANIDGSQQVWVDTLHTTKTRAETRIKKLQEKYPSTPFEFSITLTHFGHRVAPIYTNASSVDDRGVPDMKRQPRDTVVAGQDKEATKPVDAQITDLLRQVIILQHKAIDK